jgi:hypothetical protein
MVLPPRHGSGRTEGSDAERWLRRVRRTLYVDDDIGRGDDDPRLAGNAIPKAVDQRLDEPEMLVPFEFGDFLGVKDRVRSGSVLPRARSTLSAAAVSPLERVRCRG